MTNDVGKRDRIAVVVYGSETGNALDYAGEAGRLLQRLHFQTIVTQLDNFDPASLGHFDVVVAIVSTTGQGDLPVNARSFWKKLLRKKLPPTYLSDVEFTTFGLGDSSYPKSAAQSVQFRKGGLIDRYRFNWAIRKVHKRLLQLGAVEIYPRGEADEQHEEGPDAAWVPWTANLRQRLLDRYPLDDGVSPIPEDVLLTPRWLLSNNFDHLAYRSPHLSNGNRGTLPDDSIPSTNGDIHAPSTGSVAHSPAPGLGPRRILVEIEENERLTPQSHWQDVRHLRLTSASSVAYAPGDILTIFPENSSSDVNQILDLMGWTQVADMPVKFELATHRKNLDRYQLPPMTVKQHGNLLTLRKLLRYHLDFRAVPRRSFFSAVAHFTQDRMHKERLMEFTDPKYIDELYDYTSRPRRSILEVLQEFHSIKIPWQWAAYILPELRGRQFSIASGGSKKYTSEGGTNLELLVAIVKYKTVIKTLREGVCTRYLAGLPIGAKIEVAVQTGGLNIQKMEAKRPVVMVGPGTGLAPMRSLIWERYDWQSGMIETGHAGEHTLANRSTVLGKTVLFYGCRNRDADFFYREEWNMLKEKMPLKVFTAFSRDQQSKIYVQDILKQQSQLVYDLLCSQNGLVYVCGSSGKMPQAVRAALVHVFSSCSEMDESTAESYLQTMEKEGRYKQETW
ncbi:MAG: hypothetical protein Q9219_004760 [cf. Caloplaca sp. 3 TL-2023]